MLGQFRAVEIQARRPASQTGPGELYGQEALMHEITREKFLKVALIAFGAIFFTIYPLGLI